MFQGGSPKFYNSQFSNSPIPKYPTPDYPISNPHNSHIPNSPNHPMMECIPQARPQNKTDFMYEPWAARPKCKQLWVRAAGAECGMRALTAKRARPSQSVCDSKFVCFIKLGAHATETLNTLHIVSPKGDPSQGPSFERCFPRGRSLLGGPNL